MKPNIVCNFLLILGGASAAGVSGFASEVKHVDAVPQGESVRIEVELTNPVQPAVHVLGNPFRLVIDFPNSPFAKPAEHLAVNKNGVSNVTVSASDAAAGSTRVVVAVDSARPYAIDTTGNKFSLSILPHSGKEEPADHAAKTAGTDAVQGALQAGGLSKVKANGGKADIQVSHLSVNSAIDEPGTQTPDTGRRDFNVKYIVGNTIYINGGANSGLREGMHLDIVAPQTSDKSEDGKRGPQSHLASVRVVGVAATSAITEVSKEDGPVCIGDVAKLAPNDAGAAAQNAEKASRGESLKLWLPETDISDASSKSDSSSATDGAGSNMLATQGRADRNVGTRIAGRIGFDSSGISSHGSTPGTSMQKGMSIQSDMTHILGTHWNLQGYWRGRINRHSQFQQPTIEESLNKTYTMQLYYDNPQSKWSAGIGRLYLPWAVSLDTIDGGYFGRKLPMGITAGAFAGSTPDISSWDYRPNHRIAGPFVNITGGDYEKVHYSSTAGLALSSIGWKLDRPYAFFENEASYKNTISVYHSLIADTARGLSTNGMRLPPGISHSYFAAHYQPGRRLSFDVYHNYFRDVPTATTTIVGTGLVDRLLFQGISAGVHVRPTRNVTLYTTLGESSKTGDAHRSLNQMYGASWNEIAHSGFRADLHYSKFDSNFGRGDYKVVSLSRQVTNRAFWNLQIGEQDLLSRYTTNNNSMYIADSLDINIGRRSYFQSGYTFVNGASLNYRQWYFSWGFRLDKGKDLPEYVETIGPVR